MKRYQDHTGAPRASRGRGGIPKPSSNTQMSDGPNGGPAYGSRSAGRNPSYQDGRAEDEMGDEADYPSEQTSGQPARGPGHQQTNQGPSPRASKARDGVITNTRQTPGSKDMTDGSAANLPARGSRRSTSMGSSLQTLLAAIRNARRGPGHGQ